LESALAEVDNAGGKGDGGQFFTIREGGFADAGDAVGDGRVGQVEAAIEGVGANDSDAAGNGDRSEAGAVLERGLAKVGEAVGQGGVGQAETAIKSIVADGGDVAGNGDAAEARALEERAFADAADGGGNDDAGQVGVVVKGEWPDGGDGQVAEGGRDGNVAARAGVTGNGEGDTIGIGGVSELGLHRRRGGQEQQNQNKELGLVNSE
jgi:hypothetical protein